MTMPPLAILLGAVHTVLLTVQARLDSLLERTEAIGSKTIETFEGRDDHLMYRAVRYGPVERQQSDLRCILVLPHSTFCILTAACSYHKSSRKICI